jgi:hypothetical protein
MKIRPAIYYTLISASNHCLEQDGEARTLGITDDLIAARFLENFADVNHKPIKKEQRNGLQRME